MLREVEGDVHLIPPPIGPERVGVSPRWGKRGHKSGKMQEADCNDDGWRCHVAALLWDIMLVRCPLRNRFYCLWMGRGECVLSAVWGDKMMKVEGSLLIWTLLCQFKSALLLRRKERRSRSTPMHLLKCRCLSDRGFTMRRGRMRRQPLSAPQWTLRRQSWERSRMPSWAEWEWGTAVWRYSGWLPGSRTHRQHQSIRVEPKSDGWGTWLFQGLNQKMTKLFCGYTHSLLMGLLFWTLPSKPPKSVVNATYLNPHTPNCQYWRRFPRNGKKNPFVSLQHVAAQTMTW